MDLATGQSLATSQALAVVAAVVAAIGVAAFSSFSACALFAVQKCCCFGFLFLAHCFEGRAGNECRCCLLYTSDAADE